VKLAYLHGFASGPRSRKAARLRDALAPRGAALHIPDLNQPSFEALSFDAMLAAVDAMDEAHGDEGGWGLVGSSLGGWVAARWAELRPARVRRLLLLCPAFDVPARWPRLMPEGAMAGWREAGSHPFADGAGVTREVHYGFYEEATRHPACPEVPGPTVILHGRQDDRVPFESSARYAAARPHVTLVAVDDGHDLLASTERVHAEVLSWLERALPQQPRPGGPSG
jgi:uncharacterized protein